MGKKAKQTGQMAFAFDPPRLASAPASLARENAIVAELVAEMLHGDSRPREIIAAEMSLLLSEDVSKSMLDAYASPARADFNISHARFKALVAVTTRYDLLDRSMRSIGAAILVGDEVNTARLGHLEKQRQLIAAEIKAIKGRSPLIGGN